MSSCAFCLIRSGRQVRDEPPAAEPQHAVDRYPEPSRRPCTALLRAGRRRRRVVWHRKSFRALGVELPALRGLHGDTNPLSTQELGSWRTNSYDYEFCLVSLSRLLSPFHPCYKAPIQEESFEVQRNEYDYQYSCSPHNRSRFAIIALLSLYFLYTRFRLTTSIYHLLGSSSSFPDIYQDQFITYFHLTRFACEPACYGPSNWLFLF